MTSSAQDCITGHIYVHFDAGINFVCAHNRTEESSTESVILQGLASDLNMIARVYLSVDYRAKPKFASLDDVIESTTTEDCILWLRSPGGQGSLMKSTQRPADTPKDIWLIMRQISESYSLIEPATMCESLGIHRGISPTGQC